MTFILTLKRSSRWKWDDPHSSNLNGSLSKEASATLALSSILIPLLGACHYGSALWQGFLMLIVIHWHYLSVSLQLPGCTSHHFLHKSLKPHFFTWMTWQSSGAICLDSECIFSYMIVEYSQHCLNVSTVIFLLCSQRKRIRLCEDVSIGT